MRILLTGSSGWLGRFLAPQLRARGDEVIGLDVAPGDETNVVGSVADPEVVARAFDRGVDAVIHAAALHKPDIVRYPAQAFVDVNITGTLNLLAAATAAGHDRFIFTSTTSLMISQAISDAVGDAAEWLDETSGPLAPRNIYGVTKRAAEDLCRLYAADAQLACVVLRTSRFFPEDDDSDHALSGENMKANELLHRRLTVEDAAEAHIVALDRARDFDFETFIISAPTPFDQADAAKLKINAPAVITRHFPDAAEIYARHGWELPQRISRVYDSAKAERLLGFRCKTDFASVLNVLRADNKLPFRHDPNYISPKERSLD